MLLGRLTSNATRALTAQRAGVGEATLSRLPAEPGRVRASGSSLPLMYKCVAAAVVICSVACVVTLDAAAAFMLQAARLNHQASAACDAQGNDTNSSLTLNAAAVDIVNNANSAFSVQCIFEALALTFISLAYPTIVALCVAMFRRAEATGARALASVAGGAAAANRSRTAAAAAIVDDTIHAAALQRRRLCGACIAVLATFPLRAVFDLMSAYTPPNP